MNWKLLKVFGIVLGILSIIFSLAVFTGTVGYYESALKYGGDAYTGIQNAAAQTANNIKYLGETLQIGLAGLLLVQGLAMLLGALCIQPKKLAAPKEAPVAAAVAPMVPVAPMAPVTPVAPAPQPAPVAPQPTTWTCPSCSHTNEAAFRFCQSCGTPKP
jgi:hypothetical protein